MKTALARLLALLLLAFGLAVGPVAAAAPAFPALTGRVVDQAGILPPGTAQAIAAKLEALEASTGRQFVVVTVSSLQGLEIEDYGHQLGRTWGIGEARKNTGVILLVAPDERRVRIEVGYGLEPILTDALSSKILQDNVLPLFRDGKMADGVVAGAEAIIAQLLLPPDQARAQAAEAADAQSAGGALPWMVATRMPSARRAPSSTWCSTVASGSRMRTRASRNGSPQSTPSARPRRSAVVFRVSGTSARVVRSPLPRSSSRAMARNGRCGAGSIIVTAAVSLEAIVIGIFRTGQEARCTTTSITVLNGF